MDRIWAIATNTIRQALRMKIALVFIVLLLVLLPVLAWGSSGDGTPKGRIQTFVSYGMSLTSLLLSVLTIFVTTHTATSDIVQRQVFTVLCKPIRRWEFLLGKFVGVLFLDLALLVLFSSFIYITVRKLPRFLEMTPLEAFQLDTQFYTARYGILPAIEEANEAEIEQLYEELEIAGELVPFFEEGVPITDIKQRLRNVKRAEKMAAAPGHNRLWEFNNVRLLDPNDELFIRFKYDVAANPPDLQIHSYWEIGDDRQYESEEPPTTPIWREPLDRNRTGPRSDPIRTAREFAVPAQVIAKDGYLGVRFINAPTNMTTVIFPSKDGLEVMYRAGTFGSNFLRAVLLLWFRLVYIGGISLLAASFLSFPVAILACFVAFVVVSVSGFITEAFTYMGNDNAVVRIFYMVITFLVNLLPKFDSFNPSAYLVKGRLISWIVLMKVGGIMIGLWAFFSVSLGLWIFNKREVARTD